MKIRIESARCKGHQNCVRAAPQLFCVGEDGFAQVIGNGEVPHALQEDALLASDNCPEFAIEIEEQDDGNNAAADRHA
jgi:ferredoxin